MLATLEGGIKGGSWYALIDKVDSEANLWNSYLEVAANRGSGGVDGQTTQQFGEHAAEEIARLQQQLRANSYRPQPARRAWIDKLGSTEKRPLGIPPVRDRVVQTALRHVLEPIFERDFAPHSYGFRPGRGCFDALDRVERLLTEGSTWVVDADLKSYFDTIPHERLLTLVRAKVSDGRVLALLESYLSCGVMETLRDWKPTECGTPQGAVISPLLANIYLDALDHEMERSGYEMTRYADDFIIQCRSQEAAEAALARVRAWVEAAGLTLHPQKTRIVDATTQGGFDFLGYHFERGHRWPREKSLDKIKMKIRAQTRRVSGRSLRAIISELNRTLRGWYGYFSRSVGNVFEELDAMTRRRLRRMLLKRQRKRGHGMGWSHRRWPNTYFAEQGLFSLKMAHDTNRQTQR
jgi:RNA-directed DNA polymerase